MTKRYRDGAGATLGRLITGHRLVALSAWMGRGTGAAVQLLTIRLIMRKLGAEPYAMYALISGMTVWFGLSDLGFGYALQNQIARAKALGQTYQSQLKTVILIGLLSFVSLTILLVLFSGVIADYYLPELTAFTHEQKLRYVLAATFLGVGAGVGNIILRAWYGEDRGWLSNLIIAGMWLVSFGSTIVAVNSSVSDKLLWCLVSYFAPQSLVPLVMMIIQYGTLKVRVAKLKELIELGKVAVRFWGLALLSALVLNTDLFVLARLVDATSIAEYAVVTKILGFALTLYTLLLAALWPLSTKLAALNRWSEAIALVKMYIAWGSLALVAGIACLCVLRTEMVHLFAGNSTPVMPSYALIVILGVYYIIRIWTDGFSMLLQSVGDLSVYWKWVPLQAATSIVAQYILASLWGVVGVGLGLIVSFLLTVAWVLPYRITTIHALLKKSH